MKNIFFGALLLLVVQFQAQNLNKEATDKIKKIEKLIKKAEEVGIDVLKEKTTIRTAEIFLEFANWDEKNVEQNIKGFKGVASYKKDADKIGRDLPNFERNDIVLMLDEAKENLKALINREVYRKYSPHVEWDKAFVEGDQITYEGKPVFLADYTWKPKIKKLEEYHGNQDGFFLTPSYVVNKKGDFHPRKKKELEAKQTGSLGFIFMNHKSIPKWALEKYGSNFKMRENTYTAYDIDHPGAREIQKSLLKSVVPFTANQKFSELGYMLCNEPHFFTQKDPKRKKLPWASGGVSHYTIDKFKIWLAEKHKNISELNKVWNTNFRDFDSVTLEIPIDMTLRGTPKWYDWSVFNMYRVTEWYQFLKTEIQKYDAEAKVHLKIMPNLWTDNARVHGIDLEALTDMSGIVGNDSGADHTRTWQKKPYEWESHYAFDWRELCMGFDFMKSVSPNKINFNSELHYLSTVGSRNLYLDPMYARATFWLAHTYGMTVSQIWFWPRKADGSVDFKTETKNYPGSNNQQPRVTNEIAMTLIDLNSYGEEIMMMQRQRKPLRIFYSKTSAINKKKHMDDVFELYEKLHFNGTPIGFVTKDIIKKQDNKDWDIVLINKTEFVTQKEFNAVQSYLNNGGTVLIDRVSFKKNEYGVPFSMALEANNGTLISLNSVEQIEQKAMSLLRDRDLLSKVLVKEKNGTDKKGCVWKVITNKRGKQILSVVNVGKTNAELEITLKGVKKIQCRNLLNGTKATTRPVLKPHEVYFVEVMK